MRENGETSWQDFCLLYYDQAISSARYHLSRIKGTSSHWDERIDEEAIILDAAMEALQKVFVKYDPSRGASVATFVSRVVHNELVDELERETKSLSAVRDISPSQEAEYTFQNMASQISETDMDNLKRKLRAAILELSPIDQSILGFFLEDPKTFIERSASSLGVTPDYVSVRKNRALAKLPTIMNMNADDYFDLFEDRPCGLFSLMHLRVFEDFEDLEGVIERSTNPIYPQFDIDSTVDRLAEALNAAMDREQF